MKKILFSFAAAFILMAFPISAFAEIKPADAAFKAYLKEIQMSQAELEEELDYMGYYLEDFENMEELKEELGDRLTAENLPLILADYDLTEEASTRLLIDNGELEEGEKILDVFTFSNDFTFYLDFAIEESKKTKLTEASLQAFLKEAGMTKQQLTTLLDSHDDSLENYEYVEDLKDTLDYYAEMTPLTEKELANFLKEMGMTRAQLDQLLARNDDSIENYDTVEDLAFAVVDYVMPDIEEMGITEEESARLEKHFETIDIEDPSMMEKFEKMGDQLMSLGELDFESAADLSPVQMAEIAAVYRDFLNAFNLKADIFLSINGEKTKISFESLLQMDDFDGSLLIEFYNLQDEFIFDMELTAEMFGADLFAEAAEDVNAAEKVMTAKEIAKPIETKKMNTVKGGKLPNTASETPANILLGMLVTILGLAAYRKLRASAL